MMRARFLLPTATALAFPTAALAQQTSTGVDITGSAGYSNNPFAQSGGNANSGFVSLDVTPHVDVQSERSSVSLSGLVHVEAYTSRYPVTDSYRASLDGRGRPSERLTVFGHVDLGSQVLGSDDQFALGSASGLTAANGGFGIGSGGVTNPGTDPSPGGLGASAGLSPAVTSGALFNDIGLLGSRDRRRSIYAAAGGELTVSGRDALSLRSFVDLARYRRFGDRSNYDGVGGTLGYSRRVSAYVRAGLQGSASRYNYKSGQGSTDVFSGEGTLSGQLSRFWTIDGSLGVSIIDTALRGSRNSTSLSGSLQLCGRFARDTVCVVGSRQARASGFNGAQYVSTADLNWQHQLSARSNLALGGSYVQEGGITRLAGAQNQYLRVASTYNRQLTQRLRGLVSARYRRVFGGTTDQVNDYGGQIGFSYHLGAAR